MAFAAGHGLAALIQRNPCQRLNFVLADSGQVGGLRLCPPEANDSFPAPYPGTPGLIVYVAREGVPWLLDARSGAIVSEDISGHRHFIARLPKAGAVVAACSPDGQQVMYLDSARPGVVHFHDIGHPDSSSSLPLPLGLSGEAAAQWATVRLGGSPEGPCVLSAPRLDRFAIVPGDTVVVIASYRKRLPPPPRPPWWNLRRWLGPPPPAPPGALDATSFAGGVAILYQGGTGNAGRLVDLHDLEGRYRETMLLPFPTIRIAAAGNRLLTVSGREEKWYLASYLLPGELRAAPGEAGVTVRVPLGPRDTR